MAKNSGAYTNTNSKSITPAYTSSYTGKRQFSQDLNEVERMTKNVIKDDFGRCSNQFTKNHKAEVFVEKSTGRTGFKEEVKYKSTVNFDDHVHGGSSKYETQLKFKMVTFPPSPNTYDYSTSKNYDNDAFYDYGDKAGPAGTVDYSDDENHDCGDGAGTLDDYNDDVDSDNDDGGDYDDGVDYDNDDGDYYDDVDYDNDDGDYYDDVDYGYSD